MATTGNPRVPSYATKTEGPEDQELKQMERVVDLIDGFTAMVLRKLEAWEAAANSPKAA